jgi:hypothetical protein
MVKKIDNLTSKKFDFFFYVLKIKNYVTSISRCVVLHIRRRTKDLFICYQVNKEIYEER